MRRFTAIILITVAMLCPRQSMAHTFTGRVERVIDGDTIIAGTNRVRLAEIDAPELREPGGQESKQALSELLLQEIVTVEWKRRGKYRRIIGQVHIGAVWVNRWLLAEGWAKLY